MNDSEINKMDPDMASAFLKRMETTSPLNMSGSLAEQRELRRVATEFWIENAPTPERVDYFEIPHPDGNIPIKICRPKGNGPFPVAMFIHGGAWIIGDIEQDSYVQGIWSTENEFMVVSPDYRLAPEHPFPLALEDCVAAMQWLAKNASNLGADMNRFVLGGASAGANLALAAAISLQKSRWLNIRALALFYGVFGSNLNTDTYEEFGDGVFGLSREIMQMALNAYAPNSESHDDPLIAPLYSSNLDKLPPTWIGAAELDVLRADSYQLAEKLGASGVSHEYIVYDGLIHGFTTMSKLVPKAQSAIREAGNYIKNTVV